MSQIERSFSPEDLLEEGDELGITTSISRKDLINEDAFEGVADVPDYFAQALANFAKNQATKGLVIIADRTSPAGRLVILSDETAEAKRSRADEVRDEIYAIKLALGDPRTGPLQVAHKPMSGKSFEEIEEEVRAEILQDPESFLVGILKLTD